jgi:hypothetical protein
LFVRATPGDECGEPNQGRRHSMNDPGDVARRRQRQRTKDKTMKIQTNIKAGINGGHNRDINRRTA